ncbi:hypothetical protein C8R45DRAFT_1210636 [Mycena sanguinolenta]|nr:hypothetical protein C8R45DRAFT_1210636 [Mycena sanguinolenta]
MRRHPIYVIMHPFYRDDLLVSGWLSIADREMLTHLSLFARLDANIAPCPNVDTLDIYVDALDQDTLAPDRFPALRALYVLRMIATPVSVLGLCGILTIPPSSDTIAIVWRLNADGAEIIPAACAALATPSTTHWAYGENGEFHEQFEERVGGPSLQ